MKLVDYYESDIFVIPETKLKKDQVINVPGYRFFGNNRNPMSHRVKFGSGGIAVLLSDYFMCNFDVIRIDKQHEGILSLLVEHKASNLYFYFELLISLLQTPPMARTQMDFLVISSALLILVSLIFASL